MRVKLVGTFALPAVFLLNAAKMDIASFDVRVLVGVLLARYLMVGLASGDFLTHHISAVLTHGCRCIAAP